VITVVVTGVVVLNVLLAQQAFQVRTLHEEIDGLRGKQVDLTEHVAALSAPGRIQTWATDHGMVTPPDVFVLAIPGTSGAAAAGGRP
jgi:cell division protein FtsL